MGNVGSGGGPRFQFEHFEGTGKKPAFLKVWVAGFPRAWFRIVREGADDRIAKEIGLSREIQSGDPRFDRDFYIEAEPHDLPPGFFSSDTRRNAIRRIMNLGFGSIVNSEDTLLAEWDNFEPGGIAIATLVQQAGDALHSFSGDVSQVHPSQFGARQRWDAPTRAAMGAIAVVVAVIVAIITVSIYKPLDGWSVFAWSLKFSVPALLAFLFLVTSRIRGQSTAHRDLLAMAAVGLIVFPATGLGSALVLNGKLDTSLAQSHEVRVLDKSEHRTRKGRRYNVTVASWRPNHARETIRISRSQFESVATMHSTVNVVTRAGRFGFEYRTGYTIINNSR